jgi:hypothetical protein
VTKTAVIEGQGREMAEAEDALAAAEAHLARLRREEAELIMERSVLRRRLSSAASARKHEIAGRALELYGRAVYRKEAERIGSEEVRRLAAGEVELAVEAVLAARRRLAEAANPAPDAASARAAFDDTAARVAELEADGVTLTGRIRAAVLAGDIEAQLALTEHSDRLPLLLGAARRARTRAELAYERAELRALPALEVGVFSAAAHHLASREKDLLRAVSEQVAEAGEAAALARSPLVRSRWQAPSRSA